MSDTHFQHEPPATERPGMGWLMPLLIVVFTAGLVLYFTAGSSTAIPGVPVIDTTTLKKQPDTTKSNGTKPSMTTMRLPNGFEIKGNASGIEKQLIRYIVSRAVADSISKERWFDFDNLNFETNSAKITDSSMVQVNNIAAILKAYHTVKIKIGGYTDKTGDDAANMKLSQERADAVLQALKDAGARPGQLVGAEGYGAQFAKAAADAPDEEKRKDRRISINVRAK